MNDDIKKYEEQKFKKTNPKEYKKLKEKEWNNILKNYYPFLLICIGYSFVKMNIDSNGDISKFYRPYEEFFINIVVIGFISFVISLIIEIVNKSTKFHKKLIWVTVIFSILGLIGMNLN